MVKDQSPQDAASKSAKIQNSLYGGGGEGDGSNFQLLMLSPNLLKKIQLLKSKIPYWLGGGGGEGADPMFNF